MKGSLPIEINGHSEKQIQDFLYTFCPSRDCTCHIVSNIPHDVLLIKSVHVQMVEVPEVDKMTGAVSSPRVSRQQFVGVWPSSVQL